MTLQATNLCLIDSLGSDIQGTFSICLKAGQSAHIISQSHTGKTRIARNLCGLDHTAINESNRTPSRIAWNDQLLHAIDARTRAATFAYLPANPSLLFSLVGRTLKQELELAFGMLGRPVDETRINATAQSLDLNALLERDPRDFSGGEMMRSALACVLVKGPKVVVADQIADQVDPDFRNRLFEILNRWQEQEGGILINLAASYREEFLAAGGRCIFFTGEKIVEGTPDDCWIQLGHDANKYFDGLPRLGAILRNQTLAKSERMPRSPKDLAMTVLPRKQTAPSITSSTLPKHDNALTVKKLSYAYANSNFRLKDISLSVEKGTLAAVLGHNGAGKTSLLKCIGNLIGGWNGAISVSGESYDSKLPLHETARVALYSFQNPDEQIYRQTVREELVECVLNISRCSSYTLTQSDTELSVSFGLEPYLEKSPFELPLSMRRLLMIASCLIARPPVLLLDEPTAWLDSFQKESLKSALERYLKSGGCGMVVSHDVDFVCDAASSLLFLDNGAVQYATDSRILHGNESLSYTPSCLKVAKQLPNFPKVWREREFISHLNHV